MVRTSNLRKEEQLIALKRDTAYAADVSDDINSFVCDGIATALQRLHRIAVTPQYGGNLAAGRYFAPHTLATYECHFRGLIKFFKIIGDYESLLMLRDERPVNCPSMNVNSCVLYLKWKFQPRTAILTNMAGQPLMDVTGSPINCTGAWNDPKKQKQFAAALHCVHISCQQGGQYQEMCAECRVRPDDDRHKGCETHSGNPRLLRSGEPNHDTIFVSACRKISIERLGYVSTPCGQLLPMLVRSLRTHLLSSNSLVDLQTMTTLMISICLFLRFDDIEGLMISAFQPEHFVFDGFGHIRALCLKVCGKTDNQITSLLLWRDDTCPEFCPVRLLLVYLHISGIKSGTLFPSEEELIAAPASGVYSTSVTYDVLNKRMTHLVRNVLGLPESFKVGLHMSRRTAYLFAIFGDGKVTNIAPSARHKDLNIAMLYAADALAQKKLAHIYGDPLNLVKKWVPFLLQSTANALLLGIDAMPFQCDIVPLAEKFVLQHIKIAPSHPAYKSPVTLCFKSLSIVIPADENSEAMNSYILTLAPEAQKHVQNYIQRSVNEGIKLGMSRQQATADRIKATNTATLNGAATPTTNATPPPQKKARTFGNINLPHIALIKNAPVRAKVQYLLEMHLLRPLPEHRSDLTDASRQYMIKYADKVQRCYAEHCSSSIDEFVSKYPKFTHTTFKCRCV